MLSQSPFGLSPGHCNDEQQKRQLTCAVSNVFWFLHPSEQQKKMSIASIV